MKIETISKEVTTFIKIHEGDVFVYNNRHYMKIYADSTGSVYNNAVDLENYVLRFFDSHAPVIPKEAKLVIV